MSAAVVLSARVRDVLSRATCTGRTIKLPAERLDKELAVAVRRALEAIGGRYNRKAGGFLMDGPAAPWLAMLLHDGENAAVRS